MAVSLSVMVFFSMGIVLTRCLSLWRDATAHWRLAQYARISRERILYGGFTDPSGGLLSASNVVVSVDSGWKYIQYTTATGGSSVKQIRGWDGLATDKNIQLRDGSSPWVYGQSSGAAAPIIQVDSFVAAVTNDLVTISYRMIFSAAGKTFTQPHTIQACLVNKE